MRVLTHFSREPLELDRKRQYAQGHNFKPVGLWLSDEDAEQSWCKWCHDESFDIHRLTYETAFECDTSRWLVIDTAEKLCEFSQAFRERQTGFYIDWRAVKNTTRES